MSFHIFVFGASLKESQRAILHFATAAEVAVRCHQITLS